MDKLTRSKLNQDHGGGGGANSEPWAPPSPSTQPSSPGGLERGSRRPRLPPPYAQMCECQAAGTAILMFVHPGAPRQHRAWARGWNHGSAVLSSSSPASQGVPQSRIKRHADLHFLRQRRQAGEQRELRGSEDICEYQPPWPLPVEGIADTPLHRFPQRKARVLFYHRTERHVTRTLRAESPSLRLMGRHFGSRLKSTQQCVLLLHC